MKRSLLFLALLAAACATPSQPVADGSVTTSIGVEAGTQFELKRGQQANVAGTNLRLRFDGITEDSRCPEKVQCVWAGNAAANLRIMSAEKSVTLNTGIEPRTTVVDAYTITLVNVKPNARQGGIGANDYRVVLEVKRR
jgi:hypothetical protein